MAPSTRSVPSLSLVPAATPPAGVVPDFVQGASLASEIISVSAVSCALAVLFLSIRLYSSFKLTRSTWYDDIACVCAVAFSLAYAGLIISIRDKAKHAWDLPITSFTSSYLQIVLTDIIVLSFGFWASKMSILLLQYRLFGTLNKFRYLIYIGGIWNTLIHGSAIVISAALCVPRSGEGFSAPQVYHRCGRQIYWAVIQGVMNVMLDFFILSIPMPLVWKLQLDRKKKWGVTAIFMTGFIACVASALSLAIKAESLIDTSDTNWNGFRVAIFNMLEVNVAIMVACMPACASFFRSLAAEKAVSPDFKPRLSFLRYNVSRLVKSSSDSQPTIKADNPEFIFSKPPVSYRSDSRKARSAVSDNRLYLPPQVTIDNETNLLRDGRHDVFGPRSSGSSSLQRAGARDEAFCGDEEPKPAML